MGSRLELGWISYRWSVWSGWLLVLVGTGLGRNNMCVCVFIPYFMIVCFESLEEEGGRGKKKKKERDGIVMYTVPSDSLF